MKLSILWIIGLFLFHANLFAQLEDGIWIADNTTAKIKVNIKNVKDGFIWKTLNVDMAGDFYKRISDDEFRYSDPDGVSYCLVKVKTNKIFDDYCNGFYIGEFNLIAPAVKSTTDLSSMNGEWISDNGKYTVITKTNGDGFDAWNKQDPANKVFYKRGKTGEYTYTSPYGTSMVLKMLDYNRLESFQNGQHFDFFSRAVTPEKDPTIVENNKDNSRDEDEWVSDYGNKANIVIDAAGVHWKEKNQTYLYRKISPDTYMLGTNETFCKITFNNNNRFTFTYSSSPSVSYYTRSSALKNQHKGFIITSPVELDAKELAEYNCKIYKLQKKLDSNPKDAKSKQEMEALSNKMNDVLTAIEKRYTSKKDKDSFMQFFNTEMSKCK